MLAPVRTGPGAGARFAAAAWLAAALVPAAALALYFAPVLFGPHSILVGDNLTHSLPLDRLLADALAGDGLRFWNEAASFGAPLHAEATTGWFHPWKLLLFAALPWLAAHDLVYVTSFLLTGLAVLLVGARVGLPPGLALAGALAAAFSPTVLGNVYNEAYALALAWCALALAAFETWYPRPSPRRTALLAVAIALAALAGYPPMLYAQLFFLGVVLLVRLALDRAAIPARVLGFAAACALGIGLAAFQVLPMLELAAHSVRQEGAAPLQAFPWQDWVAGLLFVNDPALYEPNRFVFFQAPLGTALALPALFFLPALRGRVAWSYVAGTALCVGAAGGPGSPIFDALRAVLPGFDRLRIVSPFLFATVVPLGVLLGLLLRRPFEEPLGRRRLALCTAWIALFALVMAGSRPGRTALPSYLLASAAVLAVAIGGAALFGRLGRPAWAGAAAALALLIEVAVVKAGFLVHLPDAILEEGRASAAFLAERQRADPTARAIHLRTPELERAFQGLVLQHWKTPGYESYARANLRLHVPWANLLYGLAFAGANDALPLAGVPALREAMQAELHRTRRTPPGERLLDRYRVRWVVVAGDPGRVPIAEGLRVVWRAPGTTILENDAAGPIHAWQPAAPAEVPAVSAWQRALERLPWVAPDLERRLAVEVPAPGRLFVAIPYHPGWTVAVDGVRMAPQRADDGVGMSIPVERGATRVVLRFTPYAFHAGLVVAAGSALATAVLLTRGGRRR